MGGNAAMRDLKFMINYGSLGGTADAFPEILEGCKEAFEAVRIDVKGRLDGESVLIHGDFWSGK